MNSQVAAIIVQNGCVLLSLKTNILGTTYDFPMWDFKPGHYPIELINDKVKTDLGLEHDNKRYAGQIKVNGKNIYLYIIKKWKGKIKTKNFVWVHKSVLMMNRNSLPVDDAMLQEIFK